MANVLEYIISLKDQASAVAHRFEAAVTAARNEIDKASGSAVALQNKTSAALTGLYNKAKSAIAGPKFLTNSIEELEARLKEVDRVRFGTVLKSEFESATKEAERLEKKIERLKQGISGGGIGSKIAGWRKDFVSSLPGANLIKNPLTLAGAAIGGFWMAAQKAMNAGKEKMKLQVLTGSKEIGASLYEGLTKYATDTVFGSELYGMATQMLANGIKDSDVLPVMKQLGDISMGDSDKLGQLSLAFAQINGKGHLAGQELLQLINAGFNPLQVLSEKTGENMESLTNRMAKGQISIAEVRKAMQLATGPGGKFNGMLDKVANTPYGQLEGLRGQLEQMMIEIGSVFLPIATKFMQLVSWIGEKLGPALKPAVSVIGILAAGILVATAAQWAWNAAQLANPITWIIVGIVALIALIVALVTAFDGWGNAWKHLVDGLKFGWLAWVSYFKLQWLEFEDTFMHGIESIEKGWYKVKKLWDKEGAQEGLSKLKTESEARANAIAAQKKAVQQYADKSNEAYSKIFGKDGLHYNGAFSNLKDKLANKITPAVLPGTGTGTGSTNGNPSSGITNTNNAIATGGTKNTTVNITIGNLVRDFKITAQNLNEAKEKIRDQIVDEITRAVAMGAALGS